MKKVLAAVVMAGFLGLTVGCAEEAKKPAPAPAKVEPGKGGPAADPAKKAP